MVVLSAVKVEAIGLGGFPCLCSCVHCILYVHASSRSRPISGPSTAAVRVRQFQFCVCFSLMLVSVHYPSALFFFFSHLCPVHNFSFHATAFKLSFTTYPCLFILCISINYFCYPDVPFQEVFFPDVIMFLNSLINM